MNTGASNQPSGGTAFDQGRTCRTCRHLDTDARTEPCCRCIRFAGWQPRSPAGTFLPEVDARGSCTACGRHPNDGHWCAECDGWPAYAKAEGRQQ